ncbi:MAG TPA: hypothetical protein VIL74_25705 [Pyrinomonadaceae bacterium]|jgi:outer membrane protein assembly factor BamB
MRNKALIIFVLSLFIVSARPASAADVFPLKIEKIAPGVTQVSNVADVGYVTLGAQYTPDGKYLIVTAGGEFCVLPTENLDARIDDLGRARVWKGEPSGYLPSGKIVFSTVKGLSALDPATEEIRTIYEAPESEVDPEHYYLAWRLIVLSDELIVSGDGDSADGSPDGNILRFDVRRGRRTRGASIPGFYNPRVSPSRKYILFEHGNGLDQSYAEIYDIARDRRHRLAGRFNLRRAFPKYEKIIERPVAWIGADTFLAEVEKIDGEREISDATYIGAHSWLVSLNAATGAIVWKTRPKIPFGGSVYQQLSATKMLIETADWGLYELSLANGKAKRLANFEGQGFALSPDKKKLAYFGDDLNRIYVSALNGAGKRKVLDVPENWALDRWSRHAPLWSPDGGRLIVFGKNQFLFARL